MRIQLLGIVASVGAVLTACQTPTIDQPASQPPSVAPVPEAIPPVEGSETSTFPPATDEEIDEIWEIRDALVGGRQGVVACLPSVGDPIEVEFQVTIDTTGEWVDPQIHVLGGIVTDGERLCMEDAFYGVATRARVVPMPVRKTFRLRQMDEADL